MFSRFIVGHEVWEEEKAEHAKYLIRKATLSQGIAGKTLVLHSDWVDKFVKWYNKEHLHSGINFLTPYQRHYGLDKKVMENRIKVYKKAKKSIQKDGLRILETGNYQNM